MAPAAMQNAGWVGAELGAQAEVAALAALQQENAQLRARVSDLASGLQQALEEVHALRRDRRQRWEPLPITVHHVGGGTSPALREPETEPSSSAPSTPEHAYVVAPPPGLPPPALPSPVPRRGPSRLAVPMPPGLLRSRASAAEDSELSQTPTCLTPTSSAGELSDGGLREAPLQVLPAPFGTCVEWRVEGLRAKLKANCGFPLLSPTFSLGDLSGIRLMFIPGAAWAEWQMKTSRKQQSRRKLSGAEGPQNGALKLKAPSTGDAAPLRFYLVIGGRRQGPCRCDFTEHAIQGCDIECNWLEQMDRKADCLHLRLEFV